MRSWLFYFCPFDDTKLSTNPNITAIFSSILRTIVTQEGKNRNLNSTNKLNTLGHEIRMQKLEYEQCIVHDVLEC